MDIKGHGSQGNPWQGTFYCPLIIKIFDSSGTTLIAERTFNLLLHFMNSTIGGGTTNPLTLLTIDQRYTIADNIPIYSTGNEEIHVATIKFLSNEAENKFQLKISPSGNSNFQFKHTNPSYNNTISYKVRSPQIGYPCFNSEFLYQFPYQGTPGSWNSFIEIKIKVDDFQNNLRPGAYQSNIVLSLENNF